MFVNGQRLPHLLKPLHYSCPRQFKRELGGLFDGEWQPLCAAEELALPGDFVTRRILGVPVLARNFDGELRAFLNVCSHRHCTIRGERQGHSRALQCQYHGWEYQSNGTSGNIPDAQSFKPLPGGPERLAMYPIRQCGPMVFVSLREPALPLEQWLSKGAEQLMEYPAKRWRLQQNWEYSIKANWKIPIENTIETYHIPIVHPDTLVRYAPEDAMHVELSDQHSFFSWDLVQDANYVRRCNRWLTWIEPGYTHSPYYATTHILPACFCIRTDLMLQFMAVRPVGPSQSVLEVWLFILTPVRRSQIGHLVARQWGKHKESIVKAVLGEDLPLYEQLQEGLMHSPFHGTISTREELIFNFQNYIVRKCGMAAEELQSL